MAQTVIVHHPDKPGSTIRVTAKAYRAGYAQDGYVEGAREGDQLPAAGRQVELEADRLKAQLADAQAQLRAVQAQANAQAAAAAAPPAVIPPGGAPRTDNPPAKATPRKRAPRTRTRPAAAAPEVAAPVLSPGPPDIDSTPALD